MLMSSSPTKGASLGRSCEHSLGGAPTAMVLQTQHELFSCDCQQLTASAACLRASRSCSVGGWVCRGLKGSAIFMQLVKDSSET